MIEMLGVLAIIGVLSAGGIMGYTAAMENYRVNKYINDMAQVVSYTQNVFIAPRNAAHTRIQRSSLCAQKAISGDYCKSTPSSPLGSMIGGGEPALYIGYTTSPVHWYEPPWNSRKILVVFTTTIKDKSACVKLLSSPALQNLAPLGTFLYHRGEGTVTELPASPEKADKLCVKRALKIELWLGVVGQRLDNSKGRWDKTV